MELQDQTSHPEISSSSYARKAWYTAYFLLSLRRPATPAEIADKLAFLHWSPEFVEFLCWIRHSPLVLTESGLVALSSVAVEFLDSLTLGGEIGGWPVPVRTYYRKRKRSSTGVVPLTMKRRRSDLMIVGVGAGKYEVSDADWLAEGSVLQSYDGPCTTANSISYVLSGPAEATSFHLGIPSDKVLTNPFKRNYRQPTMSIEDKKDKLEQNALSLGNTNPRDSRHVYLDSFMHHFRILKKPGKLPYLLHLPSSSSPQVDSLSSEGMCTKDYLSNIGKYALSYTRIDDLCHSHIREPPSSNGNVGTELEVGCECCDVQEQNKIDPSSSSVMGENESMNDSKNKIVTEASVITTKCTLSPYKGLIQNQQNEFSQSREDLSKMKEQIDILPEEDLRCPNACPCKNKNQQIPKNHNSNQEEIGCFCTSSFKAKSLSKIINLHKDALAQKVEEPSKEQRNNVLKAKCLESANAIPIKNKGKQIPSNMSAQEKNGCFPLSSPKDHLDSKAMPKFDIYFVEDEEGSGGYGTVYRARRKSDGTKFAIKYPHPNANKHHIVNERKMLERFGGKDFIIKYEGSCKSENSDCCVLKHVEHDRPDVLRKDINISELQWYGYCMFIALRSLHKQGVVHRDVKPGNFLFSRKTCIGYIIDFNLAKDLNPKQVNAGNYVNPQLKAVSPSKRRKTLDSKAPEPTSGRFRRELKPQELKMLRNKALEPSHRNFLGSQGADGSGLTSVKDLTSTKSPSAERLREPLPCFGRKELINLAQEAMQNPEQEVAGVSSYKRKRIAAPSAAMRRKESYYTPMPIHSPGSGFSKEGGKKQKEGSCSGTKGFRAPEVLLRSPHQSPKLDVWSAGVTLLYLMTGRMAFTGDPEQNMKDIVKLKGSEELWEVARLHGRESSFPKDLYDSQNLTSMELRSWCRANTKRPEFLKLIPNSLFDLVDKCLSVNPRSRISAEDALRHEFFGPCIDAIRKKRLLKQHAS